VTSALITFLIFSNSFLFNQVAKNWEGENATLKKEKYDAVIILGGYSGWNEKHSSVEFNESSDRFIRGLELYKKGLADKILLTGGSGLILKPEEKESFWIRDLLETFDVNANDIIIESESRNTNENALNTEQILKEKYGAKGDFILITSAFHMNRAEKCFSKTGLNFESVRVDFMIDDNDYTLETYVIPSASTLSAWQLLIKEWLGYAVYWAKGYL